MLKRALAILDGAVAKSGTTPAVLAIKDKDGTTETTHSMDDLGNRAIS